MERDEARDEMAEMEVSNRTISPAGEKWRIERRFGAGRAKERSAFLIELGSLTRLPVCEPRWRPPWGL